jgi:hypothetical protein
LRKWNKEARPDVLIDYSFDLPTLSGEKHFKFARMNNTGALLSKHCWLEALAGKGLWSCLSRNSFSEGEVADVGTCCTVSGLFHLDPV